MPDTIIELPFDRHPMLNLTFPIAEMLVEPIRSGAYDSRHMSTASETSEHTFETAISRLEHLVEEMESDRMPLEQLLVAYEEGTKLVKVCFG
jgi:exodeoxyribonuclease VII small subunit